MSTCLNMIFWFYGLNSKKSSVVKTCANHKIVDVDMYSVIVIVTCTTSTKYMKNGDFQLFSHQVFIKL